MTIQIEYIAIDALVNYERNARTHSDDQVKSDRCQHPRVWFYQSCAD